MASRLVGSFPKAYSSMSTGGSWWRSEKCATDNYRASSYVRRASWQRIEKLSEEYCKVTSLHDNNLNHHFKCIEVGYKYDKRERKYFMNATSAGSHEPQPLVPSSKSTLESIKGIMSLIIKLARPYAIFGMLSGVLSSSSLAVESLSDLSPAFFIGLSQHTIATFCMFVYHTALNDLADIEIDKINKPYNPLASGQYSQKHAAIVAASCLFVSVGIAWLAGSWPTRWGILTTFVLGTAYCVNLPWLRWKRFTSLTLVYTILQPLLANNLASFLHIKTHVFKRAPTYSRSMIFTFMIMTVYCVIIAIYKDIPDIEGDKAAGIHTLASRLGPQRVFWSCVSLLEMGYGVAILVGVTYPSLWSKFLMISAHAIMALFLWYNAKSVNVESKAAVQSLYSIIFKLASVEYIVIALAR